MTEAEARDPERRIADRVGEIGQVLKDNVPWGDRPFYDRHRDDDFIDAVEVVTVPRYKTSGLSGDEWRFGVRIRLYRKGVVLYERGVGNIRYAGIAVAEMLNGDRENYMVPDFAARLKALDETKCANPGCTNDFVSEYRLKMEYSREGFKQAPYGDKRIRFCQKHLKRGDCGLQDADVNYEVVSGPGPDEAKGYGEDISESGFGGTVRV